MEGMVQFSASATDYKEAAKAVSLAVVILRKAMPNPGPEDKILISRIHDDYLLLIKQAMLREVPLVRDSAPPLSVTVSDAKSAA